MTGRRENWVKMPLDQAPAWHQLSFYQGAVGFRIFGLYQERRVYLGPKWQDALCKALSVSGPERPAAKRALKALVEAKLILVEGGWFELLFSEERFNARLAELDSRPTSDQPEVDSRSTSDQHQVDIRLMGGRDEIRPKSPKINESASPEREREIERKREGGNARARDPSPPKPKRAQDPPPQLSLPAPQAEAAAPACELRPPVSRRPPPAELQGGIGVLDANEVTRVFSEARQAAGLSRYAGSSADYKHRQDLVEAFRDEEDPRGALLKAAQNYVTSGDPFWGDPKKRSNLYPIQGLAQDPLSWLEAKPKKIASSTTSPAPIGTGRRRGW